MPVWCEQAHVAVCVSGDEGACASVVSRSRAFDPSHGRVEVLMVRVPEIAEPGTKAGPAAGGKRPPRSLLRVSA